MSTAAVRALVAHPGTQYAFRLAAELHQLNALLRFHTGFALSEASVADRLYGALPNRLRRIVANRRTQLPPDRVRLQPAGEILTTVRLRRGAEAQSTLHSRNARFQHAIPAEELTAATAVIGFDTSSWILSRRCSEVRIPLVLDQSIGHPDSKIAVFERVRRDFPDWADGIEPRLPAVRQAEGSEHDSARLIVAASTFTRTTLLEHGIPAGKIRLNPYGVDCERFSPVSRTGKGRPFRFLFVGAINARKGVPLLIKAWDQLRRHDEELWLVGPAARETLPLLPRPGLRYHGAVPNAELPALFAQCDVLVFPSYFEGFGLVILEAMASGLPVISTSATAAPDIYRHGEGGWIFEPGNIDQLAWLMSHCLAEPAAVRAAGQSARVIAERFTWQAYGRRWLSILREAAA